MRCRPIWWACDEGWTRWHQVLSVRVLFKASSAPELHSAELNLTISCHGDSREPALLERQHQHVTVWINHLNSFSLHSSLSDLTLMLPQERKNGWTSERKKEGGLYNIAKDTDVLHIFCVELRTRVVVQYWPNFFLLCHVRLKTRHIKSVDFKALIQDNDNRERF